MGRVGEEIAEMQQMYNAVVVERNSLLGENIGLMDELQRIHAEHEGEEREKKSLSTVRGGRHLCEQTLPLCALMA